ncbi:MAG: AAA family ATPase [Gemmatimonadaceae bacterium]|nr:AAA family ATPase [Gemmatimonadaceae bacterium]
MPRFADLDDEQRSIYQGAPPDGSILVVGPPGTGKTVMAFHRATYLRKLGQSPSLIMFSSVLANYAGANNSHAKDIDVSTMHSWATRWFRRMGAGSPPMIAPHVHDWGAIAASVQRVAAGGRAERANWGHLIVDEGQDFPPAMYGTLAMLLRLVWSDASAPALSVFADENQRLTEQNSTIADIRQALALLGEKRVFELSRNYRNTKQIARFAAHYYCGLRSGIPRAPSREGPKPVVSFHRGQPAMLESIIELIEEARDRNWDVGIVCPKDRTRKYIYSQLQERYASDDDVVVQSYSYKDESLKASDLKFDYSNTVTVLSRPSVKGLEFDAVVVVDPFLLASAEGSGEQQFKMNMYVSCSRAREYLQLCFVSDPDMVRRHLPAPAEALYEVLER